MMNRAADNLDVKHDGPNATAELLRRHSAQHCIAGCALVPKLVTQGLAELVTERLNMFPAKHGISKCCSPNAIVSKQPLDCKKHCRASKPTE